MKFVIVILAVVFNLTLVVLYSRGLVGGNAPQQEKAATPVAERSASSPYKPDAPAESSAGASRLPEDAARRVAGEKPEPVLSGDGKEVIDPKDGKELVEPVAEEVRPLRLRSIHGHPSAEVWGGREARGILGPANRANLDPPVVSPEAR